MDPQAPLDNIPSASTATSPRLLSEPKQNNSSKKRIALSATTAPNGEYLHEPSTKKRKLSVEEIEVDITAPEPPSKKALRRLKKGKPLPPSKSGAESNSEPETKQDNKSRVEKRSEHGVWIGNLSWTTSKDDLRKFLVDYSDLTEDMITRIHMPNAEDKKSANKTEERKVGKLLHNKGFAYVDLSTPEAVELAIELSEQLLSGRRLLIKNNKSFEGRPQKTKDDRRDESKPPSKRIFLGNLSFDTTEDSLKEHFEKCGIIESIKVASFEDSGKCKGYAWIEFQDLESAQAAVRGYVHIKEEDPNVSESESDVGSDEKAQEDKPMRVKTRKWWVNKIKGRPLRMEFAEAAQVRYKKRYGKDGTKGGIANSIDSTKDVKEPHLPNENLSKEVLYDLPYGGPRLTGGIVASTGRKTTF